VDLKLTEAQEQISSVFGSFFDKESPTDNVRAAEATGFDAELWAKTLELGVLDIAAAIGRHDPDVSLLDATLVAEQFGRALAPIPLVEAMVAAAVLEECGAAVDAGSKVVTFSPRPARNGVVRNLEFAPVADAIVVRHGDELVLIDEPSVGTARRNLGSLPMAELRLDRPGTVLATGDDAERLFTTATDRWRVLYASALTGLAARALEIGVEYAKERWQFGVPIGAFQSLAHRFADVSTAMEGSRLLVQYAAWSADEALPKSGLLAAMAYVFAAESAMDVSAHSLHVHGGYGFMMEYDIQLYLRRARAWSLLLGDTQLQYAEVADRKYGKAGA